MAIVFLRTAKEAASDTWRNSRRNPVDRVEPTGRWFHARYCPWRGDRDVRQQTPDCVEDCDAEVKIVLYEGKVLTTRERNYHDDSDFYAVVWDEVEGRLTTYEYATTRFAGSGSAGEDATPEVLAKASEWLREWALSRWREANEAQSLRVKPDREVEVFRGRKVPIGTCGIVEWIGEGRYGRDRARIVTANGATHWVDACNLRVIEPERYLLPDEKGAEYAEVAVTRQVWHLPFATGCGLHVL